MPDFPFDQEVSWRSTGDAVDVYRTGMGGEEWLIRVGDYPDERLYALVVNGIILREFDDWPARWSRSFAP